MKEKPSVTKGGNKYEYDKKWAVEGVYLTFKRIFGEMLRATSILG